MNNLFEKSKKDRIRTQQKLEKKGSDKEAPEGRTVLSLSISKRDKELLKIYCARQGKTAARTIHEWIEQYCTDEE